MGTTRRTIAVAGAAVAVGAAALMTAGVAAAAAPGRCAENVNVRAEPSRDAAIVAVCEAGTAVTTGRVSDGFVELTDLDGWAAAEYVEVDGRRVGAPAAGPVRGPADAPVDGRTDEDDQDDRDDEPAGARAGADDEDDAVTTAEPHDDPLSAADDRPEPAPAPPPAPAPAPNPLGGLL